MAGGRNLATGYCGRHIALAGDPVYRKMIEQGVDAALDTAVAELSHFPVPPEPAA
jgi:hypothetical protein